MTVHYISRFQVYRAQRLIKNSEIKIQPTAFLKYRLYTFAPDGISLSCQPCAYVYLPRHIFIIAWITRNKIQSASR